MITKKFFFIVLLLLFLGIILILFTPVFNVKNLVVSGSEFVSREEISDRIGFETDKNIFLFNKLSAKKKLLENYFVRDAKIKILLPDTISVELDERVPCCYIKYLSGSFILLDENGFVIECKKSYNEKFPVVDGLSFDTFVVGKNLGLKNIDSLKDLIKISKEIIKNDIKSVIIDMSDLDDIHLRVNRLDVVLGDVIDYQKKISVLKSVLDSDSPYLEKAGVLYLESLPPVLKFIT